MKRLQPVLTFAVALLLLTACEAPTDSRTSESAQAALEHAAPKGGAVCKAAFNRHEATSAVVLDLDPAQGEFPEGIAVDRRGSIYVGLRFTGQVLRFRPGKDPEVVTQFEAEDSGGGLLEDQGLLGLETDHRGNVYAAVASFDPITGGPADTHGVWRIAPNGDRELVPGTEAIFFPNALTFDPRGNLYISSSTGPPPSGEDSFEEGGIWKVPPGRSAELWLRDEELTGTGGGDPPIGANGIAHHPRRGGSIFVANTEKRQIVEVPIRPRDGSAGEPRVAVTLGEPTAENPFAGVVDGLAVDACGNLYPLLIGERRLVRVSPDGSEMETLADFEDGLQTPTSLAFGSGKDARSVFIAEFARLAGLIGEDPDPKVVKVDVGIPGSGGQ